MVRPEDDGGYPGKGSQKRRAQMTAQRHSGTRGRLGRGVCAKGQRRMWKAGVSSASVVGEAREQDFILGAAGSR